MKELGFNSKRFLLLFVLTLAGHLVSYWSEGKVISYALFFTGVVMLLYDLRSGAAFYFYCILIFDDISKYDLETPALNTIFTNEVLGLSVSLLWSAIVFIAILPVMFAKKESVLQVPAVMFVIVIFLFVGISRLYQVTNPQFISDVGFVVNIIIGYCIARVLLHNGSKISHYFGLVLMIFFSKYIIFTFNSIYSSMTDLLYTFRAESAANYIALPLLLILLLIFGKRVRLGTAGNLALQIGLVFLVAYLFITISRERLIFCALAVLIFLVVFKKIQVLLYMGLLTIVAVVSIRTLNPNMYNFIYWKVTSIVPSGDSRSASSSVRLMELQNIWHEQLVDPYKLAFGTGWGGYFTPSYAAMPEELLGTSSYPVEWIQENRFYRPHGTYLYVLLKYGAFGLVLFYGAFLIFAYLHVYDRTIYAFQPADTQLWSWRYIQLTLAIGLAVVSLVIFSSKLQLLTGFFIYMLGFVKTSINKSLHLQKLQQNS